MRKHLGGWGLFAATALSGCQEPTQVELRLSTDLPCDGVHGTAVTVGRRGELEDAFPSASLTVCEPAADGSQHLGLVVLVPRDDASHDTLAIKVVAAVTARSIDDCKPGETGARGYQGCVVARRELRYRSGQTLRLEVPLLRQCEGVECTVDSTCFDATTCIPAGVTCTNEGCSIDDAPERRSPNPSDPGTAGGAGTGGGAGATGAGGVSREAGAGGGGGASGGAGGGGTGANAGSGGTGSTSGQAGGQSGGRPVVSQIAAGYNHSCAIVEAGQVYCWGGNTYGQLGDGTKTDRPTPIRVLQSANGPPLTDVQSLALGGGHSCAILSDGGVRCWGKNTEGQLGDGTATDRLTPVPVRQSVGGPPWTGAQEVALGYWHSCARLIGGEVRCWGYNGLGQLGDGSTSDWRTPMPVLQSPGGPPLTGVQELTSAGFHSCARLIGGEARCWGDNAWGQLGDGTTTTRPTPMPVLASPGGPPLTGVQGLRVGVSHSCAQLSGGEVRCWGDNYYGQLGDDSTVNRLTPVPVHQAFGGPPLTGVKELTLGYYHSCARLDDGEALCWGSNLSGGLGDGTTATRLTPVPVLSSADGPPLTDVQGLAAGVLYTCARLGSEVWCWGHNEDGQLGTGTTSYNLTPVPVQFVPGAGSGGSAGSGGAGGSGGGGTAGGSGGGGGGPLVSQVVASGSHSCALVEGGEVRCWGRNDYGQLGDGTDTERLHPVPVLSSVGEPPLTGVRALALGDSHSCAQLSSGEVRCWGDNGSGQLGDGTATDRLTPVPVLQSMGGPPLAGVQEVALGYHHSCARLIGGDVWCWGANYLGQLGDGTPLLRLTPVPVLRSAGGPPLTGVQEVALGLNHSCARLSGGEVQCWGETDFGQLGNGATTGGGEGVTSPVLVLSSPGGPPLTGVQALALGQKHSCALLSGGKVLCWGYNISGQLGDGTAINRLTPVPVLQWAGGPPLTNVQTLSLGWAHSCAVLNGGEARCWGWNGFGSLGDGTNRRRLTPVPVLQWYDGPPLSSVQALVAGFGYTCGLLSGSDVRCWGSNTNGQLGDGTTQYRYNPVPVIFP